MDESVLISFAILTVEWEQRNRGYVDNFVPFAAQCIKDHGDDVVSAANVRTALEKDFGLLLPLNAIRTILERCRKLGLVDVNAGIYRRNAESLAHIDLEQSRARAAREHEALVRGFVAFLRDELGEELEPETAEAVLLDYLKRRSLPIMRRMLHSRPLNIPSDKAGSDYQVARFITWVCDGEPQLFIYLQTVVKGFMLASVLYLPEPANFGGPVSDLRVLLDTPLLLGALGLHGAVRREANDELLDALRRLGARLECLTITLGEVRGVLDGCARTLRLPRTRLSVPKSVLDYAVEVGMTATDLEVASEKLEEDLRALGIRVVDPPPVSADNPVDEGKLEEELRAGINYRNRDAAVHDALCLAAVFRLRRGQQKRRFEEAKAIFVTTNSSVVRVSRYFFKESMPRGDSVPVAALDHEVGTVTWLKSPQRMPDFPARLVLADAYAALNPSDAVWEKYLESIERHLKADQISDSDYVVLRYSMEAKRALMQTTRGRAEAFSLGTVDEILETARRNSASELALELAAAREETVGERKARQEAERAKKQSNASERQGRRQQELKIEAVAERLGAVIARVVFYVLTALLAIGVVVGLFVDSPRSKWSSFIVAGLAGVGIVVGFVSAVWGNSAASLASRVETMVSGRLKGPLLSLFGPAPAEEAVDSEMKGEVED